MGTRLNVGSQQFELSVASSGFVSVPSYPTVARRVRAHAGSTVTWPSPVRWGRRGWAGLLAETKGLQNPRALIAPRARVNIPISNYVYNSGGAPAAAV